MHADLMSSPSLKATNYVGQSLAITFNLKMSDGILTTNIGCHPLTVLWIATYCRLKFTFFWQSRLIVNINCFILAINIVFGEEEDMSLMGGLAFGHDHNTARPSI